MCISNKCPDEADAADPASIFCESLVEGTTVSHVKREKAFICCLVNIQVTPFVLFNSFSLAFTIYLQAAILLPFIDIMLHVLTALIHSPICLSQRVLQSPQRFLFYLCLPGQLFCFHVFHNCRLRWVRVEIEVFCPLEGSSVLLNFNKIRLISKNYTHETGFLPLRLESICL